MITIDHLTFGYQHPYLYHDASTTFQPGRIYGFLGKNGAGKTTLFKLISGLLRPHQGTCTVMGHESKSRHPDMLKDLFYVPESFYLPTISINKYVTLHAPFYPSFDYQALDRMLSEFDLQRHHLLQTLSHGLKKRFLLGFALASGCRLILLDEPTNGLDIPAKRHLRQVITGALNDDQTIIVATHQIKEIENIFDSLVFIDRGQILLNTRTDEIARRFVFKTVSGTQEDDGWLYAEKVPGGFSVIQENTTDEESQIDVEFFFTAVIHQPEKLMQVLNAIQGGSHG